MKAKSMLSPGEHSVRGMVRLIARLWIAGRKYHRARPKNGTVSQRLCFDLTQLEMAFARVLQFQKALGLEMAHFVPQESFDRIYVATASARREFEDSDNTVLDTLGAWEHYRMTLEKLSFDLNPFQFGEVCTQCYGTLAELNRTSPSPTAEGRVVGSAADTNFEFNATSRGRHIRC